MASVLYSVSSVIGKALSVKDRISMTLAHPSFKAAHEEFDYQTWDVSQWTASDRENVNIWSEKMRALVRRKPRISDILIFMPKTQVLHEKSIENMFKTLFGRPSLLQSTIYVYANESLPAFVKGIQNVNPEDNPCQLTMLLYLEQALPFCEKNLAKLFERLASWKEQKAQKGQNKNKITIKCIHEDIQHSPVAWNVIVSNASVIDEIITRQTFPYVPYLESMDLIPEIRVNIRDMMREIDFRQDRKLLISSATWIRDSTVLSVVDAAVQHVICIATRCRRLKRYQVDCLSSDMVGMYNGQILKFLMETIDESTIQELHLSQATLVCPGAVALVRYMLAFKKRAYGIYVSVASSDTCLYALCGELICRYIPDVLKDLQHDNSEVYRTMSHACLLEAMHEECPVTASSWKMLIPP